jgi:hypothetical protein
VIKKIFNFFSAVNFFQFFVFKNLDPNWIQIGSGSNEYGSEAPGRRKKTWTKKGQGWGGGGGVCGTSFVTICRSIYHGCANAHPTQDPALQLT